MENKGKNIETKIDLDKLNEQDWGKYRNMRKVAFRTKTIGNTALAGLALAVILIGLIVGGLLIFLAAAGHANVLAYYSNNQTVALLHNSNTSFNNSNYTHWTNATLSTLISAMKNNPKALSAFAVNTYTTMQSYYYLNMFLIVAVFILIITVFFSIPYLWSIPRTYKYFRKELNRLAERDENLRVYGYTEHEIAWYHAVRSELIKLELEYQM